jgi:uncharacterized membrane protein
VNDEPPREPLADRDLASPAAGASFSGALARWRAALEAHTFSTLAASLASFALSAASLALFCWSLASRSALAGYVRDNQLPANRRMALLGLLLLALLAGSALGLWLALRASDPGAERFVRSGRRVAPLMLVGFLPSFFCWRIWVGLELEFGLLVSAYGALLYLALREALVAGLVPPASWRAAFDAVSAGASGRAGRWLPLGVVLLAATGYAAYFAYYTIHYHHSVLTLSWDLGLEDNIVWNVLHGGPFMKSSPLAGPVDSSHFGYHAALFAYVIAPFYALWPRAEALLVLQAVLIAAAAIPLFLFAERRLGSVSACVIALAYLLYPGVHGANLYDFHYLPIGIVFLWSTLYFIDSGRYRVAAVCALLTLSIREDMAADLAVMAGFIALATPHLRAGVVLGAVSVLYFMGMKLAVMPRFMHGGESFIWQWRGLTPEEHPGFGGVLMTVVGNPLYALRTLLVPEKLLYFVQLAVPLAFLPWRRAIGFYLTIPGLLFTLLTVDAPPLVQISFQYTAHWVGFVFIAVVANIEALGVASGRPGEAEARRRAWLGAVAALTLIASYQFGAVLQRHTVRGGFAQYKFDWNAEDEERYAGLQALIAQIPPDAKVVSSEYVVPHVSNRADAYTLRLGLYDAEYLLFQLDPRYENGTALPRSFGRFEAKYARQALRADFGVVDRRGAYVLAQRGHSMQGNGDVLSLLR